MSHNNQASDLLAKVLASKKCCNVNTENCGEDKQTTQNQKNVSIVTDGTEIWCALLKAISETVNNPVYYSYEEEGIELMALTLISQVILVLEPLRSLSNLVFHQDCKNIQEKLLDKAKCLCECPQKENCKCPKNKCSCKHNSCTSCNKFKEETCCFLRQCSFSFVATGTEVTSCILKYFPVITPVNPPNSPPEDIELRAVLAPFIYVVLAILLQRIAAEYQCSILESVVSDDTFCGLAEAIIGEFTTIIAGLQNVNGPIGIRDWGNNILAKNNSNLSSAMTAMVSSLSNKIGSLSA